MLWLATGVDSAANDAGMVATPEIASASDPTASALECLARCEVHMYVLYRVGGV